MRNIEIYWEIFYYVDNNYIIIRTKSLRLFLCINIFAGETGGSYDDWEKLVMENKFVSKRIDWPFMFITHVN